MLVIFDSIKRKKRVITRKPPPNGEGFLGDSAFA